MVLLLESTNILSSLVKWSLVLSEDSVGSLSERGQEMRGVERRREPRLRLSWESHIFLEDIGTGHIGRMVDLNSCGAAVLVDSASQLWPGREVELGFMYPKVVNGNFQIMHYHKRGTVKRDDWYSPSLKRVVIEFHERLPDMPAVGNEYIGV